MLVNAVISNGMEEDDEPVDDLGLGYDENYYASMYSMQYGYMDEFENAYEMAKDQIGCRVL